MSITADIGRGMPYYRHEHNKPLGEYDANITAAIVIQHGDLEYAEDFLCYIWNGLSAVFPQNASDQAWYNHVLVIAPQFWAEDQQSIEENYWDLSAHHSDLYWTTAEHWMDGDASASFKPKDMSPAPNHSSAFSFDYDDLFLIKEKALEESPLNISSLQVYDEIMGALGDTDTYPNLAKLVITGFSAGGQLVQRYALGGMGDADLANDDNPKMDGVDIKHMVFSPSSYAYLDSRRPVLPDRDEISCAFCDQGNLEKQDYDFDVPGGTTCAGWNIWKYGLSEFNQYMEANHGNSNKQLDAMRTAYCRKTVTYGVGTMDIYNDALNDTISGGCGVAYPYDSGLDVSCEANMQGYCRLERTVAYAKYVQDYCASVMDQDSSGHELLLVENYGHDPCGIYQSTEVATQIRDFVKTKGGR